MMRHREEGVVSVEWASVHDLDGCDQWANEICVCKGTVSVVANMEALGVPSVPLRVVVVVVVQV